MSQYVYEVRSDVPLTLVNGIGNTPVVTPAQYPGTALTVRDKRVSRTAGPRPPAQSMDFPTAWAKARTVAPEYHHNECSFNVTNGALLCDCDVIRS